MFTRQRYIVYMIYTNFGVLSFIGAWHGSRLTARVGFAEPCSPRQRSSKLDAVLGLSQGLRFCERFGILWKRCIFARRLEYGSAFMCSENKEIM